MIVDQDGTELLPRSSGLQIPEPITTKTNVVELYFCSDEGFKVILSEV